MSGATIPLTRPIKAHDQEIGVLVLREPGTDDVMELGYPFLIHQGDGGSAIELRPKVVAQYVVRLAAVPMPSVKQLSIEDLQACQAAVLGFFGKSAGG